MATKVPAGLPHSRSDLVEGPLKGYHHLAFAVRLEQNSPLAKEFPWLKLREPRPGVFWYDLRWFASEDLLLRLLHRQGGELSHRVPKVGSYLDRGQRVNFLAFIEGTTLDRVRGGRPGRVPRRFLDQIGDLFGALAAVDTGKLSPHGTPPSCCAERYRSAVGSGGGESTEFLRLLTRHTVLHAYKDRRGDFEELMELLGVPLGAFGAFARNAPQLTYRQQMLLHGDLHRKNLVVDRAGGMWFIDWELALIGDPLYDLATHLHLMDYQPDQEQGVIERWRQAVGPARSAGLESDLPHYLAYKRVQSLCTDVLRAATRLVEAAEPPDTQAADVRLRGTAALVGKALAAAREPLRLEKVPPAPAIEDAFHCWWRRARGATARPVPSTSPER